MMHTDVGAAAAEVREETGVTQKEMAIRRRVRCRCGLSMFSTVTSLSAGWSISR